MSKLVCSDYVVCGSSRWIYDKDVGEMLQGSEVVVYARCTINASYGKEIWRLLLLDEMRYE